MMLGCDAEVREASLSAARDAVQNGELIVFPTDTVYGIGADAFSPKAVAALLDAKGRTAAKPPPVLVASPDLLDVLATDVPPAARELVRHFWPGALTLVLPAQPSLQWDLGETGGTVALRMPDHPTAVDLLRRTGPLATSSANRTGMAAATTASQAQEQLGDSVAVYLDDGPATAGVASTIIDARSRRLSVLRVGELSVATLAEVVPHLADQAGTA